MTTREKVRTENRPSLKIEGSVRFLTNAAAQRYLIVPSGSDDIHLNSSVVMDMLNDVLAFQVVCRSKHWVSVKQGLQDLIKRLDLKGSGGPYFNGKIVLASFPALLLMEPQPQLAMREELCGVAH
jgi:hypothetical protein